MRLFSCNRVAMRQVLDLLLAHRPSKDQFPTIMSQDCGHKETREVIQSYGDQVSRRSVIEFKSKK